MSIMNMNTGLITGKNCYLLLLLFKCDDYCYYCFVMENEYRTIIDSVFMEPRICCSTKKRETKKVQFFFSNSLLLLSHFKLNSSFNDQEVT